MKITKFLIFLFFILVGLQSCYYDVEERLYPNNNTCDSAIVTLSGQVKPILQGTCYTCHSTANMAQGGNNDLEIYTSLKARVDNGRLINAINHTGGITPMPKDRTAKMDACHIKIIEKWVRLGAKND